MPTASEVLQLYSVSTQPCAVWMFAGKLLLYLSVIVYLALLGIHKQYLSWLQASFLSYVRRVNIHHANLTGYNHRVFLSDGIACWPQSVTVEHTSGKSAVAEEQSRRTVPRFHQYRMIFVECLQVVADRVLVVERLWYQYCHSMRKTQTRHYEKLQYVVERSRVRHVGLDNRTYARVVWYQYRLPCLHPVTVAPDGVDLSIMS